MDASTTTAAAPAPGDAARLMRLATSASVSVALILIVTKTAAWWVTDSVALLSTLVDSILDAAASLLTFFAVRHSVQPADAEHRFGHGKAEALASLGQSAFVAGSGVLLLAESVRRLFVHKPVEHEYVGIGVMVLSMALTLVLVLFQARIVRRTGSLAVSGDALHYAGDLLTNGGVIVALVLNLAFNWAMADAAIAVAIVVYLLWNAAKIARLALDQLMDRELANGDRDRIIAIARAHPETRSVHDLRTRRAGLLTFIQFHLELDPAMPLARAHEIADTIENEIVAAFPNAEVIIHEDPAGYEAPHPVPGAAI
ncbi:MAG: cation diffusion facilitator family transporter [Rhodospirillaceae bacterium]|nr:cation diffusion facilitator family transporter [Rhodospirillaceae bacterium]